MRFGMSGCFLPADMNDLTPEMCRRVRDLGFSGIFTRFSANNPHDIPLHKAHRVRDVLQGEGVRLFQVTGYWQNLVTPDEAARRESVRTLQAALRLAKALRARAIDSGPGSMNPDGPWFPHPDNWTASARRQLHGRAAGRRGALPPCRGQRRHPRAGRGRGAAPVNLRFAAPKERRVAVVTGGAQGIGRASVLRFAEEGRDIVVADIDAAGAE